MLEALFLGLGAPDAALFVNRIAVGVFFAISGYHKLFNSKRHASIAAVMREDKVPAPGFNEWFVPVVEFSAGCALVVGLVSALAASGLLVICVVACIADGLKRIESWGPLDKADYLDDVLYLPEVLYALMLFVVICAGPGPGLDRYVLALF